MRIAINQHGKMVDIIESIRNDIYICPVCKEELQRNFGEMRQYFSHPSGESNCELKLRLLNNDTNSIENYDILQNEYYDKDFSDVKINLSDEKTEEGYCLTLEQLDIIESKEDRIKISALAGSSKTSTLYYYAKARPFKKILYLVYNKSMKDEADHTFGNLPHVTIKTIHSLAYGYVGKFYRNKLTFSYGVVDIIKDLNLNWHNDMELAVKINSMLKEYMLSEAENFYDIELLKDDPDRELILHNCNRLWELKKEYRNHVKIEHDFYLKLFQLSKKNLSYKFDTLMLDECLPKSQFIKTDKGNKRIKTLYDMYINNKEMPNALSYNIKNDTFEYKPIIWAKKSLNRQLLEIQTEGLNKIQCTENHKILTQRGYVKAKDIIIGKDSLIIDNIDNQKTKYKPNNEQTQIILGSFLGDGSLSKMSKFNSFRLNFTQGEAQFEYFKSKISAFNLSYNKIRSGYTQKMSIYKSKYTKVFLLENDIWEELKNINELGLAIWFQDDGSYNGFSISIHSNQLNYEQMLYLQNIMMVKYKLNFIISKAKNKYYYFRINKIDSDKFLKLISKYMHPNMQYKTNINVSNNIIKYNNKYLNHGGNYVKTIKKIHREDVYDIEVKDNHNFVTTRGSSNRDGSGVVVHNCQDSSSLVLDVVNNSKINGVVMVGDRFQSLYGWRNAKNIMPYFEGKEYKLTTSFRVSQNIAHIANIIVEDITGEKIDMKGFNNNQKIVHKIDKNKSYACLCRTNAFIFAEVFEAIGKNKNAKLFFEGGYTSYSFQNVLDGYYFSLGHQVKNQLFNKFEDYHTMIKYAQEIKDLELLALDKMIGTYGKKIPLLINSIKNNTVKSKDKADVIFTTIHRSKGMTYTMPIYISDDHFDINDMRDDFDYYEEMCIVYVAITRCAGEIELSNTIKKYLLEGSLYENK